MPLPAGRAGDAEDGSEPRRHHLDAAPGGGLGRRACALAATVEAERLTSRDAVLDLGLETIEVVARRLHPERERPAAAVHRAGGAGRHRARQRQPARLRRRHLPARRPRHGRPADVALSLARRAAAGRRRATTCGASCACSIRSPPPRRSCASASRARSTRSGREHLARRLARAFVRGGRAARPSISTAATCASRADAARTARDRRASRATWPPLESARGGADPHPGGGPDRGRQVEPRQRARQRGRGGRRRRCRRPRASPPTG